MGKQRLFILPFPLALNAAALGRLTINPEHPYQDFFDLEDLPPNVRPKTTDSPVVNFSSMAKASRRADLEAVLSKFASVFFESGETSVERLLACKATEYVVLNSGNWYDTLCGSKKSRLWLEKQFVAGSQSVYLITGYRTLVEAQLHQHEANDMTAGGKIAVPTGEEATDLADTLRVSIHGGYQNSNAGDRALTVPEEKIFAVQYRQVKITWYRKRDVDSSFLEPNHRWVEIFSMRNGSNDSDAESVYEATLGNGKDDDIPEGCETLNFANEIYCFKTA